MPFWDVPTGSQSAQHRMYIDLVSQSQAGNSSVVRGRVLIHGVGGSTFTGSAKGVHYYGVGAAVNGTYTWPSNTPEQWVLDFSRTVSHDSAGNLTLTVTSVLDPTGLQGFGNSTNGPRSYALPRIPKPPSVPAAPTLTNPAPGTIRAVWLAPANNGATITGYKIQIADNASFTAPTTHSQGATLTRDMTGLAPGTHWVRVAASNSAGTSAYSAASSLDIGIGGKRFNGTSFVAFETAKRATESGMVDLSIAKRMTDAGWVDIT